ncbi:MAG TPA: aspartate carbamoyltransferase catalytic subunit [Xanthomonadaceae bacterium]|nr:aspartate carbamoyltransferase catalytic subunit [Xanthomonadaceae bacterium]
MSATQIDNQGRLRHLLSLAELPAAPMVALLGRAAALREAASGRAAPPRSHPRATLGNLFMEPSTRTRASFELAARRLGLTVLNLDAAASSARKGESLLDTLRTLEAMGTNVFAIRHSQGGTAAALAAGAAAGSHVLNAGDGRHSHPTQGLLDALTIADHKGADFSALRVTIAGDIRHSRVARSDLAALRALGTGEIRLCGPAVLLPDPEESEGCRVFDSLDEAVAGCDVVIMLRLQRERMDDGLVPSLERYTRDWCLTPERLARAQRDAIVMHPGPMNRGVEIDDAVADGAQSVIFAQVANGVAVRMAVLDAMLGGEPLV